MFETLPEYTLEEQAKILTDYVDKDFTLFNVATLCDDNTLLYLKYCTIEDDSLITKRAYVEFNRCRFTTTIMTECTITKVVTQHSDNCEKFVDFNSLFQNFKLYLYDLKRQNV